MARRTVGRKPSKPTNLVGTRLTGTSALLTWSDNASDETGYQIQRRIYGTTIWQVIATTSANVATYTDPGLSATISYEFRVRAVTAVAESPYSNAVLVTDTVTPPTPPLPSVPQNFAVTPGDAQATARWSPASNATSYTLKRSAQVGGPYATVQAGITDTQYLDTGLVNGTPYYWVVVAVNSAGSSANSAEATATPTAPTDPTPPPDPVPALEPPTAPTNLVATAGDTTVGLGWSPVTNAAGYYVKRGTASGGPYTTIATVVVPSYLNTGLANGTPYYFVVSAFNDAGVSANSAQVSATPAAPVPTTPNAPSALTAVVESASIRLAWTDNASDETGFQVERKVSTDANFALLTSPAANIVTYRDSAVTPGVSYQYRVRAVNSGVYSAYSNIVTSAIPIPPPPTGNVWRPATAADFQAALNNAIPGDTIYLTAGATYTGWFILPNKPGTTPIIITSNADPVNLPGPTTRTGPQYAAYLPKLRASGLTCLETADSSHHWRIEHVEFLPDPAGFSSTSSLFVIGDTDGGGVTTQVTVDKQPHHIVVDRCYFHDDVGNLVTHGVLLNGNDLTITNSYISGIRRAGFESHGLGCWSAEGRHTLRNNYVQAAGIGILYGGATPYVPGQIPADVTVTGNTITKSLTWWPEHVSYAGIPWITKGGFEIKNGQRFVVTGNIIEYAWGGAQPGYIVLFTGLNDDGNAPYATCKDVLFENNLVRHAAGGINASSHNGYTGIDSTPGSNITVRNNLFYDISTVYSAPGLGKAITIARDWTGFVVDHNTFDCDGLYAMLLGIFTSVYEQSTGVIFTNNILRASAYGIFGDSDGFNVNAITTYWPGASVLKNVFAIGPDAQPGFPATTIVTDQATFNAAFVNRAAGNYALVPASAWNDAGTDNTDIGVNMALLPVG